MISKTGAYRDSNSELFFVESGALPGCQFQAGTLIVCRVMYLFVHCTHFKAFSNLFYYNSITIKINIFLFNKLNMPKCKPCVIFQNKKYINKFGSHMFSQNKDIALKAYDEYA